ncbi:MAG: tRNA 2-thiocytidine biosynthesis TtcA family protein [Oscillospiraceae bacterium]|nr:tRNA 2-thiocytidine biosynthesis TtcA family protein [Oscillospiraceae bacterium]
MDILNEICGLVRRCADDYDMIETGDAVAVGVSGGKDSLLLLCALNRLREYYPKKFTLEAVTVDLGFDGPDFSPVADLCAGLKIPYTVIKSDIKEIVFDVRKEENPCSLCAKMRRGALNDAIKAKGIKKLALGHHYDDAVETFMLSLLYEGRISCFKPVTYMSRTGITQIRPMLYAREQRITAAAEKLALPVVSNPCPMDKQSKRYEIKSLISRLDRDHPDPAGKIFNAMQRLPLDGWEAEGLNRQGGNHLER